LVKSHGGEIVAEYFDIGQSRAVPWQRRPEASLLLNALKDPARPFDAVVIGEPQRAFYGNQFGLVFPLFVHCVSRKREVISGVEVWSAKRHAVLTMRVGPRDRRSGGGPKPP